MIRTPSDTGRLDISVIIPTTNRPQQLHRCIESLIKNTYKPLEIIVIDQSKNTYTKKLCRNFKNHVTYYQSHASNVGSARNEGIALAKGKIIAFTDDDCVVVRQWLSTIYSSFVQNPTISGVLGRTLPYLRTKPAKEASCPSTVTRTKKRFLYRSLSHWTALGTGNNMAYRKTAFTQHGLFSESFQGSAEDTDFILRILQNNGRLLYEPKMCLYHDRWLMPKEFWHRQFYSQREMAICYGYYAWLKKGFAFRVLFGLFKNSYYLFRKSIKRILLRKPDGLYYLLSGGYLFVQLLRGLIASFFLFIKRKRQLLHYETAWT